MARGKLTPKQEAFVREYLVDLNATQAAIRAGYSERSAYSQGQRLLKNAETAAAIQAAMEDRARRTEITADRVLQELAKLAFSNMLDFLTVTADGDAFIDLSGLTPEQAAALTEVTVEDFMDGRGEDAREVRRVKIKVADKKGALELLGKHLNLFTDRLDVTSKGAPLGAVAINVYLPDNGREAPEESSR